MPLLALCLHTSYSNSQPVVTQVMGDDGQVNVPLQFGFPYYGQLFNNSWMYDNGVVSFIDPAQPGALSPWSWSAMPFSNQLGANYFIAPLWADLAPVAGTTTYTTQGNSQFQRYNWNNLAEYYSIGGTGLRLNSFSLEIRPSGEIITTYSAINLQTSNVSVGTVGNSANNEFNQVYYASNGTNVNTGSIPNWSVQSTGAVDPCISSPLSSPSCPNYEAAMLEQMCPANPLYSAQCPGYGAALAMQNQKSQQTATVTSTTSASTTTTTTDPTKTATTTDVGGIEISTTGELIAPTGIPEVTRNSVATAIPTVEEKPKVELNQRILSIVRSNTDPRLALAIVGESIANSMVSTDGVGSGEDLGKGISWTRTATVSLGESQQETAQQPKQVDRDLARLASINPRQMEERAVTSGPSVRNGGVVEGMPGGADMTQLSRPPLDFNTYLTNTLRDVRFYQQREIYTGQQTVDNQRVARGLSGANSLLHQQMVDQQYQK